MVEGRGGGLFSSPFMKILSSEERQTQLVLVPITTAPRSLGEKNLL